MYQQKRPRTEQSGGEADWTCQSCGNVNFSFRSSCNMRKCGAPRPDPLAEAPPQPSPVHMLGGPMPGGPAGVPPALAMGSPVGALRGLQFHPQQPLYLAPSHQAPGPPGALQLPHTVMYDAHGAPLHQLSYLPQPGTYPGMPPPPPTMADSYLHSSAALQAMFPYGAAMHIPAAGMVVPAPVPVQDGRKRRAGEGGAVAESGDWVCPACGNTNYGFRTQCNMRKCEEPRPPQAPLPILPAHHQPYQQVHHPIPPPYLHQHQQHPLPMPHPQQQHQQAPPQGGASRPPSMNGGPAPEGSWSCKACGNVNYPFRTHCNKRNCGVRRDETELPSGAGATGAAP